MKTLIHKNLISLKSILDLFRIPLLICCSCTSIPDTVTVRNSTIIPEINNPLPQPSYLILDPSLADIRKIVRPIAELRLGPGVQFEVQNQSIKYNDIIIVMEKLKHWIKVYAPSRSLTGWVHRQTVKSIPYHKQIKVPFKKLPSVFVVKSITKLVDFKSKKPTIIKAEKGAFFKSIRKDKFYNLVYISQSNSIAWIKSGDIQ